MVQKIIWKTDARISFNQITDFIRLQWPEDIVRRFAELVDEKLNALLNHPELGTFSDFRDVNKSVLYEHVILYYKYYPEEGVIELLLFWDTRQDPQKLKF